jgi:hypothetical protein
MKQELRGASLGDLNFCQTGMDHWYANSGRHCDIQDAKDARMPGCQDARMPGSKKGEKQAACKSIYHIITIPYYTIPYHAMLDTMHSHLDEMQIIILLLNILVLCSDFLPLTLYFQYFALGIKKAHALIPCTAPYALRRLLSPKS